MPHRPLPLSRNKRSSRRQGAHAVSADEAAIRNAHRVPRADLLVGLVALADVDSQLELQFCHIGSKFRPTRVVTLSSALCAATWAPGSPPQVPFSQIFAWPLDVNRTRDVHHAAPGNCSPRNSPCIVSGVLASSIRRRAASRQLGCPSARWLLRPPRVLI